MRNAEYWQNRFKQLEKAQHNLSAATIEEVTDYYQQAQQELEQQIESWYQRFADNNSISMADARKWLNDAQLEELRWNVKQYIKYGKANSVSGEWMKQLENASAKVHINRLEALKIETQQSLEKLFGNQLDALDSMIRKAYTSSYSHTAFEIQRGIGIGFEVAKIDQKQLDKIISKPWAVDGYNFSERIWRNKSKLVSELHNELTKNILTGQDPQKAIDSLAKKMNTSKYNAGRLIQTEQAYFSSAAQAESFKDLGVEEYQIVATLDSRTSEICRELDGEHYPMKDFVAGSTAPPFHVNCRSTTVPYFADDFGVVGERAARGADGKTYYVPADLTYKEWEKAFVKGNVSALQSTATNGKIKPESFVVPVGVGAKAKDILVKLPDGSSVALTKGSRVTNIQTIAGAGRDRQIDIVDLLVEKYPNSKPELWKKQKGFGYVEFEGESFKAELHWYEESSVGRVKWKLKPDADGNWFYDDED